MPAPAPIRNTNATAVGDKRSDPRGLLPYGRFPFAAFQDWRWRGSAGKDIAGSRSGAGGRFIVFHSTADDISPISNLFPQLPPSSVNRVFRYERSNDPGNPGTIAIVSINQSGNALATGQAYDASISDDGLWVAFTYVPLFQNDPLILGAPLNVGQIVVKYLGASQSPSGVLPGAVICLSRNRTSGAFSVSNNRCADISGDAFYTAWITDDKHLLGGALELEADVVFTRSDGQGTPTHVSRAWNEGAKTTGATCFGVRLSEDEHYAVFDSNAGFDGNNAGKHIDGVQTNGARQIYRRNLWTLSAPIELVTATNNQGTQGFAHDDYTGSHQAKISRDYNKVLFTTYSPTVVPPSKAGNSTIALVNMQNRDAPPVAVSVNNAGQQGNGTDGDGDLSPDGNWAVWESNSTNLIPNTAPNFMYAYRRNLQTGVTQCLNVDAGAPLAPNYNEPPLVPQIFGASPRVDDGGHAVYQANHPDGIFRIYYAAPS